MKKSKTLAAAMASLALTGSIAGCTFGPEENVEEDVYGPPQPYEECEEEPEETEPVEEPAPVDSTDSTDESPEGDQ